MYSFYSELLHILPAACSLSLSLSPHHSIDQSTSPNTRLQAPVHTPTASPLLYVSDVQHLLSQLLTLSTACRSVTWNYDTARIKFHLQIFQGSNLQNVHYCLHKTLILDPTLIQLKLIQRLKLY